MKHIIKLFLIGLSSAFLYIGISGVTKKIVSEVKISQFKNKATITRETEYGISYHYVSRETSEINDERRPLSYLEPMDLLINLSSSVDFPIMHELLSFFVGGHAAIVSYPYEDSNYDISKDYVIETSFDKDMSEVDSCKISYWDDPWYTNQFIAVRFDISDVEKRECFNEAISLIGDPYNLSFVFNTTYSHYCSDLMTKVYKKAGINLNLDGFVTSLYDILSAAKAKIVMVKEIDKSNNKTHYYYL